MEITAVLEELGRGKAQAVCGKPQNGRCRSHKNKRMQRFIARLQAMCVCVQGFVAVLIVTPLCQQLHSLCTAQDTVADRLLSVYQEQMNK